MRRDSQPRTVEQAAAELNLSRATIRAWIAQRRLGHLKLGRAVRVPVSEIERAVSCERRNISAIIRATGSGEARCSVNEQTMEGD